MRWRTEYRVVVFPDPVGPGDEEHPVRVADEALELLYDLGLESQVDESSFMADLSRIRSTAPSPSEKG